MQENTAGGTVYRRIQTLGDSESEFRRKLCSILSGFGYYHRVYSHHAKEDDWPHRFSVRGVRRYVDLLLLPNPRWPHRKTFPVIAIETKVPRTRGDVVEAIVNQIRRYAEDRERARYFIDGKEVPPPALFLLCTSDSWNTGWIYLWHRNADLSQPGAYFSSEEARRAGWRVMTDTLDAVLWQFGGAVLRKNGVFYANTTGSGKDQGRQYSLETPARCRWVVVRREHAGSSLVVPQ